jgi:hypothetical protein
MEAGERPERAVLGILVLGLALAPAYLGGNALLAWGVNATVFPLLAVGYEVSLIARSRPHPMSIRHLGVPAALFFAVLVWILLQTATWLPHFVQNPIWSMLPGLLGRQIAGSISVDLDLSTLSLLNLVTVGAVFWLSLQLGRNGTRANFLLTAIAVIGVVYAAYGLLAFAITPGYTLWYPNDLAKSYLTSTFFNRNNYGTYAGIALCTLFGLTLSYYRRRAAEAGVPLRYKLATLLDTTGTGGVVLFAGAFITFVSLMMTGSRGAIACTLFGLLVIGMLGSQSRKRGREQRLTVLICTLFLAAIFFGFGDDVFGRIESVGVVDTARLAVARITLNSVTNSPVFGHGAGTFADVFPLFRDRSIYLFERWQMAHNTYLEAIQGLGPAFGLALIAAITMLVVKCARGATTRYANLTPSRVAVGVSLLVGLHALIDFSLQIQAVALTFAAILGAGVAQSESSRVDTAD